MFDEVLDRPLTRPLSRELQGWEDDVPPGTIVPGLATIAMLRFAPTVITDTFVSPAQAEVTVTGFAPTVTSDIQVDAGAPDDLTVTGYAPNVYTDIVIQAGAPDDLTITGYAPSLTSDVTVFAGAPDDLAVTGYAPTPIVSEVISAGSPDDLALIGYAPTVETTVPGGSITVEPPKVDIILTAYAPTVIVDQVPAPAQDDLTVTGYAPLVAVSEFIAAGAPDDLVITGYAPLVSTDTTVLPGQDDLTVTAYAPTVVTSTVVSAGAPDDLAITGQAPTIIVDQVPAPANDTIAVTRFAPTVIVDQVISAGAPDELVITEYAPTVSTTGGTTTHSLNAYGHYMSYSGGTYTATVSTSSIQEGYLVLAVVFDRSGTSGAHATHSMSDDNGGTWTKILGYDNAITNSTHRCAMSVYYHIGTATDEGDTVACTSESGDIYNGLALYIYRPDSGTYNYNSVGFAVDGTGTLLTDMTTPLSSGSTSSISGSNLLSIGIAAGREAGGSSFDAINDVGFTNHNEDYLVQSAAIDHAGTWAIAHLSGQAGGTFEAEYDCNNSGIEGIVAVVVFEDGA